LNSAPAIYASAVLSSIGVGTATPHSSALPWLKYQSLILSIIYAMQYWYSVFKLTNPAFSDQLFRIRGTSTVPYK
ncbi:MAG: hypothetical protein WCD89_21545, partial [Anaerocolumna sp.]